MAQDHAWVLEKMLNKLFLPKPESAEALLKLNPARRYAREEVVKLLALMAGIVVDGIAIQGFSEIKEMEHWYTVDVDYGAVYETWYFFKREEVTTSETFHCDR